MPDHQADQGKPAADASGVARQWSAPEAEAGDALVGPTVAGRSDARARQRLSVRALVALQPKVGNQAVSRLLQRDPAPAATAPAPADNIAALDKELSSLWVSGGKVADIINDMTATEKHTVLAGYRDRMAKHLSFSEMKLAVNNLGAELPVKLDWMQAASLLTLAISYGEIQDLVTAAPQTERDMLKNDRWKSFFKTVCDNTTIITAVTDLKFDLVSQLNWIKGEASALFSLNLAVLKPLLTAASPTDLAAAGGDAWLPFWKDVCTNATMAELVTILFPGNLLKQLQWMAAEGTDFDLVKARVTAESPDQRLTLYGDPKIIQLLQGFGFAQIAELVQLLAGTPAQQMSLFGRMVPISMLTWATPSQDWVDAIKGVRTDPMDLLAVAGTNVAWAPFIRLRLADMFRAKADTVFGADAVNMVWAAYADGAAFSSADSLLVFRALFGREVTAAGSALTFSTGFTSRQRYNVVNPDDATARELMKMVHPLGRNEVAAAPIACSDVFWDETLGLKGWSGIQKPVPTSFFWRNTIVIAVNGSGTMNSGPVSSDRFGAGDAYGGGTSTGTAGTGLTYFQNHVRHEIGHAVGAATIGNMPESGDDFANTYGGWKASTEAAFLASMWTPMAIPATGWPALNFGLGPTPVTDDQVRDWLVGLLADGDERAGPIKSGTQTLAQKVATIVGSIWSTEPMAQYISKVVAEGPAAPKAVQDAAYEFPGFTPPDPVPIFSTRDGNRFMTYSKAAFTALQASTGWYSLSSHFEMFAEMYTRKYSGGGVPAAVNGKDPAEFFTQLEGQRDPMFGKPPDVPALAE
jgi:hypothetical protein